MDFLFISSTGTGPFQAATESWPRPAWNTGGRYSAPACPRTGRCSLTPRAAETPRVIIGSGLRRSKRSLPNAVVLDHLGR